MIPLRFGFVFLLLWGVTAPVRAQTSRNDPVDLHTRYGFGTNVNLPNSWEAAFEYELRMVDNASEYRGSYLTSEIGYELTDWLTVFSSYRLASVTDGLFHRFAAGGQLSRDLGATAISFRPMIQYQKQNFNDDEQSTDEDTFVRTRLRAKHPLGDKVDVYASVEPYFTFSGEYPVDNWRNTLGIEYEFLEDRTFELYYIYRPDFAKSYNRTFHVVGVKLDFDLKLP